jgi:hypothetical protein
VRGLGGSNFLGSHAKTRRREKRGFGEGEIMGKIVFFVALAGARLGWFYFWVSREDAKARKGGWEGEVMGKIVSLWPWQVRGLGGSNFLRSHAKARRRERGGKGNYGDF